jgi:hypothetical protein
LCPSPNSVSLAGAHRSEVYGSTSTEGRYPLLVARATCLILLQTTTAEYGWVGQHHSFSLADYDDPISAPSVGTRLNVYRNQVADDETGRENVRGSIFSLPQPLLCGIGTWRPRRKDWLRGLCLSRAVSCYQRQSYWYIVFKQSGINLKDTVSRS